MVPALLAVAVAAFLLLEGHHQAAAQTTRPTRQFSDGERDVLRKTRMLRLAMTVSRRASQQGYDIEAAILPRLSEVGFSVVSASTPRYDATLVVDYREEPGPAYEARGIPVGSGTMLTCDIKLVHRDLGDVAELRLVGMPPSVVFPGEDMYQGTPCATSSGR